MTNLTVIPCGKVQVSVCVAGYQMIFTGKKAIDVFMEVIQ